MTYRILFESPHPVVPRPTSVRGPAVKCRQTPARRKSCYRMSTGVQKDTKRGEMVEWNGMNLTQNKWGVYLRNCHAEFDKLGVPRECSTSMMEDRKIERNGLEAREAYLDNGRSELDKRGIPRRGSAMGTYGLKSERDGAEIPQLRPQDLESRLSYKIANIFGTAKSITTSFGSIWRLSPCGTARDVERKERTQNGNGCTAG
ncbi:hypothetical protein F5J12DRAFT_780994 [Pisolithus orientalis]|uniref:uncharacterized protein n=1 Tax=Pisolithus orientalis TaxID=936130 RepID=UPI002225A21C|nr:uncharacterized protein F5J12DRAFT_780994 [Pisolithus orientalis]KAI6019950.1 hypothetical protein F5J12DRAFT_780994 [Pisolithus orientalis]